MDLQTFRSQKDDFFRHPTSCLCPGESHYQNQVYFRIQPDPGIALRFWARKPGTTTELEEQWLNFTHPPRTGQPYLEEYAHLLSEAMRGDQLLFVSGREALASWRFVEPVRRQWRKHAQIEQYKPQQSVDHLAKQEGAAAPAVARQLGMIGLGKMGTNLAQRLQGKGWRVIGYDPAAPKASGLQTEASLVALVQRLDRPAREPARPSWSAVSGEMSNAWSTCSTNLLPLAATNSSTATAPATSQKWCITALNTG